MKNLLLAICLLFTSKTVLANTSYGSDTNNNHCESVVAISKQDGVNSKSGSQVLQEYINILNSCNGTDIDSCLSKFKVQTSGPKSTKSMVTYGSCCLNVSGGWGEFAYIHGTSYCIPPC